MSSSHPRPAVQTLQSRLAQLSALLDGLTENSSPGLDPALECLSARLDQVIAGLSGLEAGSPDCAPAELSALTGAVSLGCGSPSRCRLESELIKTNLELEDAVSALSRSEERLSQILRTTYDGIWTVDAEGKTDYINERGAQILGYAPEEMTGLTPADFLFPEDTPAAHNGLEARMQGISDVNEYRMRRKDGSAAWIFSSSTPILDSENHYTGALAMFSDITDKKNAQISLIESEAALRSREASLRESERRLRQLADAMPQLVWVASSDGTTVYYNQRAREYSGLEQIAEDLWGWSGALHPDDLEKTEAAWLRAVETGEFYQVEHRISMADGSYRWHLSRAVPTFDEAGRLVRWYGTSTDIEEHKRSEQALLESEQHFQIALKNSPVVVFTQDRDLYYTWIHNLGYGFTEAEVLGHRDFEIFSPENAALLTGIKRRVIESGEGVREEVALNLRGEWVYYDLTVEPLRDEAGAVVGITGAAVDMTPQRKLEQDMLAARTYLEVQRQLLEHREMERQLIARDIHDGPIQSLVGTLFHLQMVKESANCEGHRSSPGFEGLEKVSLRLRNTIQELRDVCNDLRPPTLLRFGLKKAIDVHAHDFDEKHPNLKIRLELDDDQNQLPHDIALVLYRTYQESLNNVVRHANATNALVRLMREPGGVVLEIEDDGEGFLLPDDWIDLTNHGHFGVAGMRERVEAVGGRLEIKSSPGCGAVVRVRVPVG